VLAVLTALASLADRGAVSLCSIGVCPNGIHLVAAYR
jgi:hypothetical protein